MPEFAYVDTSALVAILCGEPQGEAMAAVLRGFRRRFAANLLEAELRAVAAREGVEPAVAEGLLRAVDQVLPSRPLGAEMIRTLEVGYLRGADLWHVAVALHLGELLAPVAFVTLDARQREVAAGVGLAVV